MKNRIKQFFNRAFQVPGERLVTQTIKSFSLAEKVLFGFFALILLGSSLGLLLQLNNSLMTEVPARGGRLVEGIIGYPRFINPLLSISDPDRDLTSIVYSGLVKINPDGELIPDLAESYEISEDGKTYTFKLKDGIEFHDGEAISSEDIVFTVTSAQNEQLKSPKRPNWIGVTVEAPDEKTVIFQLKQPYAPFLENTTLGILPKHIWESLSAEQFPFSQFNVEPIGSGPYKVTKIRRNASGVADMYELAPFRKYALGKPYISEVVFRFFSNEQDLVRSYERGDVDNLNSINPQKAKELQQSGERVEHIPLTRIFGLFLNQNQAPIFTNVAVRKALDASLDKNRIINEVLFGFGTALSGPLPPGILNTTSVPTPNIEEARKILSDADWKFDEETGVWKKGSNTLSFSISTADAPELRKTAEIMRENWESLGAEVDLKVFESGALNQTVIRPRKYDALLFGEIIGRDMDLFAFWHSSQRNDPGLNVSLYASVKSDKLLEEARTSSDREVRMAKFEEFQNELNKDVPAIFSYSPDFLYIVPKKLKGFHMKNITIPSERFSGITDWYINTDRVWNFFVIEN